MRISEFQIDRYGPLPQLDHQCDGNLEVVYGPNESGKTLLLEALLKLVDPDIEGVMEELDRVDETPQGYVVVETGDGEQVLGDDMFLEDLAPIGSMHLRNIFVVRDSDLRLEDHHDFYDSVTEQIGDLHTSEIEAIRDRLQEIGRLTDERRNVSKADPHNKARVVRDDARTLSVKIRDYVEEARRDDLDQLESDLIQARTEMRRVEREHGEQEAAETAARHERLSDRLETFERTTGKLSELTDFARDELEELQRLQQDIEGDEDRIEDLEAEIGDLESAIRENEDRLGDTEDELEPLQNREGAIDDLSQQLDAYRQVEDESAGAERSMRMARLVAGLGIGLGGLAALWSAVQGTGQLLPALLFLAVGILGLVWYGLSQRKLTARERERASLLRGARDAGLEVENVDEVPTAIQAYRDQLETLQRRTQRLGGDLRVDRDRLGDHRTELDERRETHQANRSARDEILGEARVSEVKAYRQELERKEELEGERETAEEILTDSLGVPEGGDDEDRIEHWWHNLREMAADADLDGTDPAEYDEERHQELQSELERLEERVDQLREELETHRRTIREYANRARDVDSGPFVEEPVTLQAETTGGLEQLGSDLERVAARIDRDADISREALAIFDELHEAEEEKITDLFEPDDRATEVFSRITGGRYDQVSYDPDARTLQVHRDTGQVRTTNELSHGTREQLYLAARVALAEQLLDAEPGFFLMDDAFLPADRDRLAEGFEVLQDLADDGWQILYLTAKEEVGEDMVDAFDIESWRLDPLP